ncbi:hypothetical protein [Frankia gtarii]|uniref:hypothetical protein n=1 Tax=Frankia gtarii TaxID=2950102 RepID=UPI0021BFA902|nr:hypothetical protein [Frankia gtarii]
MDELGEFVIALGPCGVCEVPFLFDPYLVPSFKDDTSPTVETDPWLPICRTCVDRINPLRVKAGREPMQVPAGVYPDEAVTP